MTKQSMETLALGLGFVLGGLAVALVLPRSRSTIVDLVDDYVPQVRRIHPRKIVSMAGTAAALAFIAEAQREVDLARRHRNGS